MNTIMLTTERLRRHLYENRDVQLSTTQVMRETGTNRKYTLLALAALEKNGIITQYQRGGRSFWQYKNTRPHCLLAGWMRCAVIRNARHEMYRQQPGQP